MDSTAVLIFASLRHSSNKFPPRQSKSAKRVFASFTRRVVKASQKVFLNDVYLAIPPDENSEFEKIGACLIPQEGRGFGERLCHSIQQLFALGYERVLVLGNDCPQLDVQLLSQARERFKNGTIILGPDQKGGVYLLGVTRENFQVLSNIEWNANTDFAQLVKECDSQNERLEILEACYDLDDRFDLQTILRRCRLGGPLRALLLDLRNSNLSQPDQTAVLGCILRMFDHIRRVNQLPPPPLFLH
ncbi:MAG: hypothetical protein DMG06_09535 [Acidobacteria bacterium]|nr:MAG: hypothetical protein DMG06_09535 [Acidobacteriota bacterium]